jgi:hypothetical protein
MMESTKWSQFLVHACIVCLGLALETFYPLVRPILCAPILPILMPKHEAKSDDLTAQVGLNIGLNPIIDRLEVPYLPDRDWGDFPENLQRDLG